MKAVEFKKRGANIEELQSLLDRQKRERRGIFEGDWEEGQFEAGMGAGMIHDIPSVAVLVERLIHEYHLALEDLCRHGKLAEMSAAVSGEMRRHI